MEQPITGENIPDDIIMRQVGHIVFTLRCLAYFFTEISLGGSRGTGILEYLRYLNLIPISGIHVTNHDINI